MKNRKLSMVFISLMVSIGLMGMIFLFSAQNVNTSDGLSMKIAEIVAEILGKLTSLLPAADSGSQTGQEGNFLSDLNHYIRKMAHLTEYMLLGAALTWHMKAGCDFRNKRPKGGNYALVIVLGAIYACSDEFHQMYVDGRGPSLKDVAIDAMGVLIGTLIVFLLSGKKSKNIMAENQNSGASLKGEN